MQDMADTTILRPPFRSVCVFCGSSETTKSEYHDLAARFGAELAARGLRLIYGGGSIGLMGRCAKAAHAAGGEVLGIMPHFLERREIVLENVPHRMVDTMHERKHSMFQESDAFVVLPGGIGTLEELFEVLSWRTLGLHSKPIVIVDQGGYWRPLADLLRSIVGRGFAEPSHLDHVAFVSDLSEILPAIAAMPREAGPGGRLDRV